MYIPSLMDNCRHPICLVIGYIVAAICSVRTAIALAIPCNWVGLRDMLYWYFVYHFFLILTNTSVSHVDSYPVVAN